MALHQILTDILSFPATELTAGEAADVLGVVRQTITVAIQTGDIEATRRNFKGHGRQQRYRISKAALIRWLWDHTTGDRAILRAAMTQECPEILRALDPKLSGPAPDNIIPVATRRPKPRPVHLPHPDQLDLFQSTSSSS